MNIKKILSNKNVVTILGALLIVIVLYAFYKYQVNKAIQPISVPYAVVDIAPGKLITSDMIEMMEIRESEIKGQIFGSKQALLNKKYYTKVNSTIPAGSLFYSALITEEDYMPDLFLKKMPKDHIAYNLSVDMFSTYGNSIVQGTFVDLYFRTVSNGKIMFGKFLENVKVLAVKDSSGRHVFENLEENRAPSQLIIAVKPDMYELLKTAEFLANSKIIILPTGVNYNEEEDNILISDEEIKAYIEENRT